jgi:hypothetical protein
MTHCTMEIDMSKTRELFDRIVTDKDTYSTINVFSGFITQNIVTVEYSTPQISSRLVLSRADAQALHAALGKHLENITPEDTTDAA